MEQNTQRGRPKGLREEAIQHAADVAAATIPAEAEVIVQPIQRAEIRPEIREEDPRVRAARRAAEIRDHINVDDDGVDEFYVDPRVIPAGWEYEWKRRTLLNEENASYQVQLQMKGWEPVPASRHPEYMPNNNSYASIERKGMVLMERPSEISEASRQAEARRARSQVRAKEDQLAASPQGQFERSNKDSSLVKVGRSYEPIPIPRD
jgi:hypothetical protein